MKVSRNEIIIKIMATRYVSTVVQKWATKSIQEFCMCERIMQQICPLRHISNKYEVYLKDQITI